MLLVAQFVGALLGAGCSWLVMMPTYLADEQYDIPIEWIVPLCPTGVSDDGKV